MTVHDEHPFLDPEADREPVRRFRGRLSAPVTVVTAGGPGAWAGLTVSSIIVAEGDPALVHFLCGFENELWDAIVDTERFVVHILEEQHREMADVFAGIRPSPGGPFSGLVVDDSEYGPVIESVGSRAYCRYAGHREGFNYGLVDGEIDDITLSDLKHPLNWFRGDYLGRGQSGGHS